MLCVCENRVCAMSVTKSVPSCSSFSFSALPVLEMLVRRNTFFFFLRRGTGSWFTLSFRTSIAPSTLSSDLFEFEPSDDVDNLDSLFDERRFEVGCGLDERRFEFVSAEARREDFDVPRFSEPSALLTCRSVAWRFSPPVWSGSASGSNLLSPVMLNAPELIVLP